MVIETKRLILRKINDYDFEAYKKVIGDSKNMIHYPFVFDDRKIQSWIDWAKDNYENLGFSLWAVVDKESGELIGDCGLTMQNIDSLIVPEIGYHIRRDLHKQGFAKEAAIAVRDWTFENTTFNRVYSYMVEKNIASQETAKSYGAKFIKKYIDTKGITNHVYAISRNEWEKINEK